ncbi:hypothetical protein DdX_21412 [Ditylenchus destructor]|uniref:Uncharacterized protein n=1 Tax=Ditylenchus destructor TaxID=166010 RepID=A0AAD4MGI3_9BILA|nr:hypothetical protein DdX_21412 [Ditylenchus destructor]
MSFALKQFEFHNPIGWRQISPGTEELTLSDEGNGRKTVLQKYAPGGSIVHEHTYIEEMFYESGDFVVPNCFTEFGDRLRQMTNEFTSLVGCYSTNQRILYGENTASRKRNSTKNVRTSEGTEIISSSTLEVQAPQSKLTIIGVLTTND